jgi:hypothetical protein
MAVALPVIRQPSSISACEPCIVYSFMNQMFQVNEPIYSLCALLLEIEQFFRVSREVHFGDNRPDSFHALNHLKFSHQGSIFAKHRIFKDQPTSNILYKFRGTVQFDSIIEFHLYSLRSSSLFLYIYLNFICSPHRLLRLTIRNKRFMGYSRFPTFLFVSQVVLIALQNREVYGCCYLELTADAEIAD